MGWGLRGKRCGVPTQSACCGLVHRCSITPDILGHRDELSTLTGEEVARAITEQRVLEKKYEDLVAVRSQLKVRGWLCAWARGYGGGRGVHPVWAPV